jgi:hypothetical protein
VVIFLAWWWLLFAEKVVTVFCVVYTPLDIGSSLAYLGADDATALG